MDNLIINETATTPNVLCDVSKRLITIKGRAISENAFEFFSPIEEWILEYKKLKLPLQVDLYFEYFNTSSSIYLRKIIKLLDEMHICGASVVMNWQYDDDDDDMQDQGIEITYKISFPISFIPMSSGEPHTSIEA
jgi:hypothetical protein